MIVIVGSAQARRFLRLADDALDDEAVRRLGEQDLLEAALVHEGADGAQDLLVVLSRTAFVDAHREPPWISQSSSEPCRTRRRTGSGSATADDRPAPRGWQWTTGGRGPVLVAYGSQ